MRQHRRRAGNSLLFAAAEGSLYIFIPFYLFSALKSCWDSEEEKGKTWEELEREASYADREKGDDSDSEQERARRKMKALGKARAPEKRSLGGSLPKRPKLRR